MTTLYALDRLGGGHRFATRVLATGPVANGTVQGDLILAGTGDPTLTSDALGDLALALRRAGVKRVAGRFLVWAEALPAISRIAPDQPVHAGYNPAISGLNLNYNRVHFEWKRNGKGYNLSMDARADRFVPAVSMVTMKVVARDLPVYTYAAGPGREDWTVASTALGKGGSRWLPVRYPELYTAEVFATLARAQGVSLPAAEATRQLPKASVLAEVKSEALSAILRGMLKYSTNLTAESIGLAASRDRSSLLGSANEMSGWLRTKYGLETARMVDHSGLGAASRISAADLVRLLTAPGVAAQLKGLLKTSVVKGKKGAAPQGEVTVLAKTGTLNFVSGLAGYVVTPGGRRLAFATVSADPARRDAVPEAQREDPPGNRAWIRRARGLQQDLIGRWAAVYAS